MTAWCAVSYGALDLRGTLSGDASGAELAVTPIYPGEPVTLLGAPAALWRRLVDGPVPDEDLTADERELVGEFEEYGIASRDAEHPDRVRNLTAPWLSSPIHELVYALIAKLADRAGVEMLFIKGPMLKKQGLREREHSGDVDVWVRKRDSFRLVDELCEWSWQPPENSALNVEPFAHSWTLSPPPHWGCEIDVHYRFPGIGIGPESAFELIASRAESVRFGSTNTKVPAVAEHAVINALHLARPAPGRPGSSAPTSVVAQSLRAAGPGAVASAVQLGAAGSLRDAIAEVFPVEGSSIHEQSVPDDWKWRLAPTVALSFAQALRLVPFRRRPAVLFRLVWPTKQYVLRAQSTAGYIHTSAFSARFARIGQGIAQAVRHRRRA